MIFIKRAPVRPKRKIFRLDEVQARSQIAQVRNRRPRPRIFSRMLYHLSLAEPKINLVDLSWRSEL